MQKAETYVFNGHKKAVTFEASANDSHALLSKSNTTGLKQNRRLLEEAKFAFKQLIDNNPPAGEGKLQSAAQKTHY